MKPFLLQMAELSSAEEFLDFFGIRYDERIVQVNRLHILQRYHQYLRRTPGLEEAAEAALRERYRELLQKAYDDFVSSSPAREKVFKVFQDAQGSSIPLDRLRQALPSQAQAPDPARR
jgi:nitrogenase-stabilizing/protective protein